MYLHGLAPFLVNRMLANSELVDLDIGNSYGCLDCSFVYN